MSQQDNKEMAKHFYRASAADFKIIPGGPIVYWFSPQQLSAFSNLITIEIQPALAIAVA